MIGQKAVSILGKENKYLRINRIWAVLHLVSFFMIIAGVVLAIVGSLQQVWMLAVMISLIVAGWLGMIITFFKMQYDLGNWFDFMDWGILFLKYQFTIYGGFDVWGIVTAIRILINNEFRD